MNVKIYLRIEKEILLSFVSIFIINNIIFWCCTSNQMDVMIYMDILISAAMFSGMYLQYRKQKKEYKELIDEFNNIESMEEFKNKKFNIYLDSIKEILCSEYEKYNKDINYYKEKIESLSDYITAAVHDLKVHIATCEMISRRLNPQDSGSDKLYFELKNIRFKINHVLYVTRANNFYQDIMTEHFNICDTVKEAVKDNIEFFISKDIEINLSMKDYEIMNDRKWVRYMVGQILNNCSKYTDKEGKIEISDFEDAKTYYLSIKDNGIGIKQEELLRIFDKGFTGSNGRTNSKSTGMGMYYTKEIGKKLNIGIEVNSQCGIYTEFILKFYKISDYIKVTEMSH